MQKALLQAMLIPHQRLQELQNNSDFTELMIQSEELKTYPAGAVWDYFCQVQNVPVKDKWFEAVKDYETNVQMKRR